MILILLYYVILIIIYELNKNKLMNKTLKRPPQVIIFYRMT